MTARLRRQMRRDCRWWPTSGVLICLVLLILAGLVGGCLGLRINLTPSVPLGIWRIVALERPVRTGDRVFVCPPLTPVILEGLRRGYLRRGLCKGKIVPLIKTVAAMPGQSVLISDFVYIDGHLLAHSRLLPFDSKGRSLSPHSGGPVPAGTVYLHSDFPGSFDSRYFGPLPRASILGLAREVWIW